MFKIELIMNDQMSYGCRRILQSLSKNRRGNGQGNEVVGNLLPVTFFVQAILLPSAFWATALQICHDLPDLIQSKRLLQSLRKT